MQECDREWRRYLENRDAKCRNKIAEWNFGLVYYLVEQIRPSTPNQIETQDLIGYGMIGLLEAMERYSPLSQNCFATYAVPRIMGSIRDGLRQCTGLPRFGRGFQQRRNAIYEKLCQELKREPNQAEIAARMGISVQDYCCLQRWLCWKEALSYEEFSWREQNAADWTQTEPLERAEWACMRPQLRAALLVLPEDLQRLLRKIYVEKRSYRSIALEWQKSKSTVARMHDCAIEELRRNLL